MTCYSLYLIILILNFELFLPREYGIQQMSRYQRMFALDNDPLLNFQSFD